MEPLLGAVWWPSSSAATCHPKKATVALAERAKQSGVNIIEHAEVSDLNNHEDRKKWGFFGISLSWAHLCPMGEVGLDGNEIESERAEELFLVRGHPSPYPYPLPYL